LAIYIDSIVSGCPNGHSNAVSGVSTLSCPYVSAATLHNSY
jgi:hypothetical protein